MQQVANTSAKVSYYLPPETRVTGQFVTLRTIPAKSTSTPETLQDVLRAR